MFDSASSTSAILELITDSGTIVGGVVGAILGLLAALIGLGWGVRKFQRHVTGRKF